MTITYTYGGNLYVNMTNKCSNNCIFCIRNNNNGVYGSDSLWLEREPSKEEVRDDILKYDLSVFKQLVFCGYGEPTERIYDLIWVAAEIKKIYNIKVRINTNGHANLINKEDVTPLFNNVIDVVSVSLNAVSAVEYEKICNPEFGIESYNGMLDFTKKVKDFVGEVFLSVVRGTIPDDDIPLCQTIAENAGVKFRIREMEQI